MHKNIRVLNIRVDKFSWVPTKNFQLENFQNRLTIYCALVLLDSFFNKDPGSTPVNSLKGTRLNRGQKLIPINNALRELSDASMATVTASMATF